MDLSVVLGPSLLMAQGYAKACEATLAYLMQDRDVPLEAGFDDLPLDRQGTILALLVSWTQLRGTLSSLAFGHRLPTLNAITAETPEGARYGSNARGVAIASRLEALANVGGLAGLTFETFWSISEAARVALGRLVATDLALTRSYDFDVLGEAEILLREGAPLVPDAATLLKQIEAEKVPAYLEAPAVQANLGTVPDQTSIQTLAQIFLGDMSRWRDLVTYNNLRAPYISSDPLDQLGDRQGSVTVSVDAGIGDTVITVEDVSQLYLDQRLYFDTGTSTFLRTIVAINKTLHQVTLDTAFTEMVPYTSLVWIYPPSYDVIGRVLEPGGRIMIPVAQLVGGRSARAPEMAEVLDVDRVYGIDVAISVTGGLSATEGDLTRAIGIPNVLQALRNRLQVPRGSVAHHPQYGCGLHDFLGRLSTAYAGFFATVESRQTLLRDPRISMIKDLTVTQDRDRLLIEFSGVTKNEEQFPAIIIPVVLR